jgi:hypothetical protein
MKFDLVIEPGVGVGCVKLGMTREAITAVGVELIDDSFQVSFDDEHKCTSIQVAVFNNNQPVLLHGHDLNNISDTETREIFSNEFDSTHTDREDLGIKCLKWEFGDDFFTYVNISHPK